MHQIFSVRTFILRPYIGVCLVSVVPCVDRAETQPASDTIGLVLPSFAKDGISLHSALFICLIITTVVPRPSEGWGLRRYGSERTFSYMTLVAMGFAKVTVYIATQILKLVELDAQLMENVVSFWVELSN